MKAIRDAVQLALASANIAGGNVRVSRNSPSRPEDVPSAIIYARRSRGDVIGTANHGVPDFKRSAEVNVAFYVHTDDEADAATDGALDALLSSGVFLALIESVDGYEVDYDLLNTTQSYVIEATLTIALTIDRARFGVSTDGDLDEAAVTTTDGALEVVITP